MKKQINYVNSLSDEYKNVLKWYTSDNGYRNLNYALRKSNKKILNKEFKDNLDLIDNIFLRAPKLEKSIVVYRGLNLESHKDINFNTNSFISTTLDYETSFNFSGTTCCILKINISAGSKILPLKTIAQDVSHEEEILLDRYCKILATYITDKKGLTLIDCVYIPEDSIDIESIKDIKESNIELSNDKIIDSLLNILGDEIELYDTMEELQIQLEDIAEKMDYKLNKDILNKIKHKLNL
jgi:hypothetical protein